MTTYVGYSGYVHAGAVGAAADASLVGELNSWTVTLTNGMNDVGVFGGGIWGAFKPGINTWTASMAGFFDCSDDGQAALLDAIQGGSQIEAYYFVSPTKYYYGVGYVSSISTDVPYAGIASFSADVQGTEDLHDVCGA